VVTAASTAAVTLVVPGSDSQRMAVGRTDIIRLSSSMVMGVIRLSSLVMEGMVGIRRKGVMVGGIRSSTVAPVSPEAAGWVWRAVLRWVLGRVLWAVCC
jgi:hypothetical protein